MEDENRWEHHANRRGNFGGEKKKDDTKKSENKLDFETAFDYARFAPLLPKDDIGQASITNVAAALAAAQAEMKNVVWNRENNYKGYRYADLAALRDAMLPVLARHNLCVVQTTGFYGQIFALKTRLIHGPSGEYFESIYPLPTAFGQPHLMGSFITYARKYSLAAIGGIAAEDDDDGQAAQSAAETAAQNAAQERRRVKIQPSTETSQRGGSSSEYLPVVPDAPGSILPPAKANDEEAWKAWARALFKAYKGAQSADELLLWEQANASAFGHLKGMAWAIDIWSQIEGYAFEKAGKFAESISGNS